MKTKSEHHTLADWDFELGATYRALSALFFVSAPTSLQLTGAPVGSTFNTLLCRIPATILLPQGEVRSWRRNWTRSGRFFTFRNQKPLGAANILDCYVIYFTGTVAHLQGFVGGVLVSEDIANFPTTANVWEHLRVFWYNGETPGGAPALCVDLYKEMFEEWQKLGSTLYDTDNLFADSAINRAGLCNQQYKGEPIYIDDTEIWGPV